MFSTELNAPWYRPEDNDSFSPYAKHTQEVEDVIGKIVSAARSASASGYSDVNFSIDLDDDFSDEELTYIQREVQNRL